MKCKICQNELEKQAIPSYIGDAYYCETCKKEFFHRQIVNVCPKCNKALVIGFDLIENWSDRVTEEICENCEVKNEM